jgi:hypothetical protein
MAELPLAEVTVKVGLPGVRRFTKLNPELVKSIAESESLEKLSTTFA